MVVNLLWTLSRPKSPATQTHMTISSGAVAVAVAAGGAAGCLVFARFQRASAKRASPSHLLRTDIHMPSPASSPAMLPRTVLRLASSAPQLSRAPLPSAGAMDPIERRRREDLLDSLRARPKPSSVSGSSELLSSEEVVRRGPPDYAPLLPRTSSHRRAGQSGRRPCSEEKAHRITRALSIDDDVKHDDDVEHCYATSFKPLFLGKD